MIGAFASAIDALFADPNLGEERCGRRAVSAQATLSASSASRPTAWRNSGDSRAVLPTIGIYIRRSQAAAIAEGYLILIGAETYRIIGEPMGYALGFVSACEATGT